MTVFENIGWLLVLIGVMILIHELGHYWAARFFDVKVEAFSFGFGPRLFGWRRGETDFRFSLILFGGYVKMAGEQPGDTPDPRGFLAKPRWQRLIIAGAGPAMNIVLAVVLLAGLFMVHYPKPSTGTDRAVIGAVMPDSAAAKAGLREGDVIAAVANKQNPDWEDVLLKEVSSAGRPLPVLVEREGRTLAVTLTPALDEKHGIGVAGWIQQVEVEIGAVLPGLDAERKGLQKGDLILSANGRPVRTLQTLHEVIREKEGEPVALVLRRGAQTVQATVTPTHREEEGSPRWMIGVQLSQRMIYTRLPFDRAIAESVRQNVKGAGLIFEFLHGILERRMSPKSLEGPIRIAQLSGEAAREGPLAFISLMATVSLNLAVFNLLPIPILDGGVILLLLIEMLLRRDLSLDFKEAVLKLGFVFLMVVVVFVLYNDIAKLLPG